MPKFIKKPRHYYLLLFFLFAIYMWFVYQSNHDKVLLSIGLTLMLGYTVFFIYYTRFYHVQWRRSLLNLQRQVIRGQRFAFYQLPYGLILVNEDSVIEWHNQYVVDKMKLDMPLLGRSISEVTPINKKEAGNTNVFLMNWKDHKYEVSFDHTERFYLFRDVTEIVTLRDSYDQEQVVVGYLYMDNYDEVGQELTDQEETLLLSNVNHLISTWAERNQILLKRFDVDKMFLVTQYQFLQKMMKKRFDILDEIRKLTRGHSIPLTLSIGIAHTSGTLIDRSRQAQSALNIALARGGDQVAVQNGESLVFFGGKTSALERRTRVRARVISHAMGNLLRDSQRVIIMGHIHPDMDAIGAAIGVACFAQNYDCKPHIILNESNPSIDRLWNLIQSNVELAEMFYTSEQVDEWVDHPDTLVVLVDTHRPNSAIEPIFLEQAKQVVVIDHHRRGKDFVQDSVLVYLEPYASSTCELVTELLQYQEDQLSLDSLVATLLLAGIVVDTKHFAYHSGARTFEAASYLRRQGASLSTIQSLLKEDLDQYIKRAEILKNTELWGKEIAIAMGHDQEVYDQLLIAQAADTLLNMKDVEASFVIAKRDDDTVAISARSQGKINVQLIMEALGGGGHYTNAACQQIKTSLDEMRKQLQKVIHDYQTTEGEQ